MHIFYKWINQVPPLMKMIIILTPFSFVHKSSFMFLFYWWIFDKFIIMVRNFFSEFGKEASVNLFLELILSRLFINADKINVFIMCKELTFRYHKTKNSQLNIISCFGWSLLFFSFYEFISLSSMFVLQLRFRSRRTVSRKDKKVTVLSFINSWHSIRYGHWICAPMAISVTQVFERSNNWFVIFVVNWVRVNLFHFPLFVYTTI